MGKKRSILRLKTKNSKLKTQNLGLVSCVLSLIFIGLSGCYMPEAPPEITSTPVRKIVTVTTERRIVGRSVENRPIECLVLGQGYDVTFILATIHGDESAGTALSEKLAEHLQSHPNLLNRRKVVILPLVNPDGKARGTRFNANGVDLNRNFASANRQNNAQNGYTALSEPEARAIHQIIRQYTPSRIISIHQPLTCIDYDGPGASLANRMAECCNLPVRKLGAKPGSLGSYAGLTLRIPVITLELPQNAGQLDRDSLWQRYGTPLTAAVAYSDLAK